MHSTRASILLLLAILVAGFSLWQGPGQPCALLVGTVTDARGPIAGATVRLQATRQAVQTDAVGHFRLPLRPGKAARVTAWKQGYLIAGVAADRSPLRLRLTPLPAVDCEDYAWVSPEPDPAQRHNCGNCHAALYEEWSASGHARSVRNRHFLNLYDGSDWQGRPQSGWNLLAEHPDGAGVCTACHAPTVSFSDEAYYDLRKSQGTAVHGVHCDYCHKVSDVATESFGQTHGRFALQLLRPSSAGIGAGKGRGQGQLFFGPLDDVDRGEDAFAPIYRESRYCASCHEGRVFGVPVYTTYSEWLASPARQEGKQCQACHMVPTGSLDNLAPDHGGIPRNPRSLSNHRFFAGSQRAMLRRCLQLHLTLRPDVDAVQAEIELRAEQVGHRVPTGFADRQLLLVIEAFDQQGKPLAVRSGSLLPPTAGQRLAGHAGRLYAKQLRDFDGRQPVPFWRAQPDAEDSRLVPGQADRSSYRFPPEACRVQLRLLYRRFWEDVALQKGWPDNEMVLAEQTIGVEPGRTVQWCGP